MPNIIKTIARDLPNGDYVEITTEYITNPEELNVDFDHDKGFFITGHHWPANKSSTGRELKRDGKPPVFNRYGMARKMGQAELLEAAPDLEPIDRVRYPNLDPRLKELPKDWDEGVNPTLTAAALEVLDQLVDGDGVESVPWPPTM